MNKDVLGLIMSFYIWEIDDVLRLRLVSKFFNRTVSDQHIWRLFRRINFKTTVASMVNNIDNLKWYHGFIRITNDIRQIRQLKPYRHRLMVDIRCRMPKYDINDFIQLGNHIDDVSMLTSVHTLTLRDCWIISPSNLGNIHTLDLSRTKVADVSALTHVHTLDLSHTDVKDVSALTNVHTLNLSYTKVTDVSTLGNVHNLYLRGTKVVNVASLTNVHCLILAGTKVVDVSALTNVSILNLRYTKVVDVSNLTKANTLYLEGSRVEDISALDNVPFIDIRR